MRVDLEIMPFIKSFTKTFGCSPKQYGKEEPSSYMVKLYL